MQPFQAMLDAVSAPLIWLSNLYWQKKKEKTLQWKNDWLVHITHWQMKFDKSHQTGQFNLYFFEWQLVAHTHSSFDQNIFRLYLSKTKNSCKLTTQITQSDFEHKAMNAWKTHGVTDNSESMKYIMYFVLYFASNLLIDSMSSRINRMLISWLLIWCHLIRRIGMRDSQK